MTPFLGAAATPFRVSVAATVGSACGQSVSQEALQDLAKARLNGAGFAVSSVHDATLAIDTECIPVRESGHGPIAVRECLTFSELVNPVTNEERATLASTWRKCESFTCDRRKCEAAGHYEAASLDEFLGYFQERTAAAERAMEAAAAGARARAEQRSWMRTRFIFFGTYVMSCLTMLLYWQFRRQLRFRH